MINVLKENQTENFLPFLRHAEIESRQQCVLESLDKGEVGGGNGDRVRWGREGIVFVVERWSFQWRRRCVQTPLWSAECTPP